jgi:putative oxidoreductase
MAPVGPLPPPVEPPTGRLTGRSSHRPTAVASSGRDGVGRFLADVRAERLTHALRWALVALFIGAGCAKLLGHPLMVTLFAMVGLGQWFRYAVGSYELVGAALLAYRKTASVGALALILLMLGAVATEVLILGRLPLSSGATLVALLALVTGVRGGLKARRR